MRLASPPTPFSALASASRFARVREEGDPDVAAGASLSGAQASAGGLRVADGRVCVPVRARVCARLPAFRRSAEARTNYRACMLTSTDTRTHLHKRARPPIDSGPSARRFF